MEEFFLQNDDLSTVTAVSFGLLYLVCLIISRRDGNTIFRRSIMSMPKRTASVFAETVRAAFRKWLISKFSNLVERAINKAQTKGEVLEIIKTVDQEMIQVRAIYNAIDLEGGEENNG